MKPLPLALARVAMTTLISLHCPRRIHAGNLAINLTMNSLKITRRSRMNNEDVKIENGR